MFQLISAVDFIHDNKMMHRDLKPEKILVDGNLLSCHPMSAVNYVYTKKMMNRDLKPDNILLDENCNMKLADFGLCKHLSRSLQHHTMCGTKTYVSPEVWSTLSMRRLITGASDIS